MAETAARETEQAKQQPRSALLTPDEQDVLHEYRRWRAMRRAGHGLTVELLVSLSSSGSADVHGGAHEGRR